MISELCIETIGNIRERSLAILFNYKETITDNYLMDDGFNQLVPVNGALGYGMVNYIEGDVIINLTHPKKNLETVRLNYSQTSNRDQIWQTVYYENDLPVRHVFGIDYYEGGSVRHSFNDLNGEDFRTFKYMRELVT